MVLRLLVIFSVLCKVAGLMLVLVAHEPGWALWIGGGGATGLLLAGLHRFAMVEAGMRKSERRMLNLHAD